MSNMLIDLGLKDKEYKWQIVWSVRNSPQEISRMINDIRIRTLLDQRKLPVLGYPCNTKDLDNRYMLPDLTNPHGMINDITIDDENRYIATFHVLDEFTPYFDCLFNPVIHPIILGNPGDWKSFKIVHLCAYDIRELDQKRIYDGIDPSGESFESKEEK